MFSKVVLTSLLGLAAAVPYGTAPLGTAPLGTGASRKPYNSANATAPTAITTVITDHVTVTDHVTATDAGCSAPTGLQGSQSTGPGASISSGSAGPGGPSSTQVYSATSQAPPPTQTFFPAHPPDHDAKNVSHLSPATGGNLYFAHSPNADTSADHMFANLDMDFKKPAVVLENSALIKNVTCTTDGLGVSFADDQGYQAAKKQWANLGKDFILASHSDGCKNSSGVYTFWDVDDVEFDDDAKACGVKASEIGLENAANTMTAKWGSYAAAGQGSNSTQGTPTGPMTPVSQITPAPSKRELEERNIFGDITSGVKSGWSDLTSGVSSVASDVSSGASSVVSKVSSAAVSHDFSTSFTMDMNAAPSATSADYPKNWGNVQADHLLSVSGVDVYAVNCWAKGHADVNGQATVDIVNFKVTAGTFSLKGNMDASLGFGIDAPDGKSFSPFSKSINLVQVPLSPFTIPEIITLGPYINLDAGVSVDMSAAGNLMASVDASMPSFDAEIDFADSSKNKQTGFEPKFTPEFHAEGTIDVSTTFSLPIEFGVGLTIPKIKGLNASVSITNTPSMTAHANYSTEGTCAHGIGLGLNFADDTQLDVIGLYNPTITQWKSPEVVGKCIPIGKNDTATNSTSSMPPGSTPTGNGTSPAKPSGTGSLGGLFPNGTSPNQPNGTGRIPFPVGGGNGTTGPNGPKGTGAPFPTGGETSSGFRPSVTGQQSGPRVPVPTGIPFPKIPFPNKNGTTSSSSSSHSSSSSSSTKSESDSSSSSATKTSSSTPSSEATPTPTDGPTTPSEPTPTSTSTDSSKTTTSTDDAPDPTTSHKTSDPEPTHHSSKCKGIGCIL